MPFKLRRGRNDEEVEIGAKDVIGMTEQELKDSLGKIDTAVTTANETKTAVDSIKEVLAGLEGKMTEAFKPKKPAGGEGGNEEEQDPQAQLNAFTLQTALESKIEVIKAKMRSKSDTYPYWDNFEDAMNKLTEKDPLQSKTQEAYWDKVYKIIFAEKYKEIQAGTIKAKQSMFIETGASGSGNQDTGNKDDKPSELDIKQAAKFNIPIEKYMATKKTLNFVGR